MSEESEIIELQSNTLLEAGSELEVLSHGDVITFEMHQYFVLNVFSLS